MDNEVKDLIDILGNTIEIGCYVVYPQMSGKAVQMVIGEVVGFMLPRTRGVRVRRVSGSRWEASYDSFQYIDERTGKVIDPWAGNRKHIKKEGHYKDESLMDIVRGNVINHDTWVPTEFQDYVKRVPKEAKPVIIRNVSNLIRVDYEEVESDM